MSASPQEGLQGGDAGDGRWMALGAGFRAHASRREAAAVIHGGRRHRRACRCSSPPSDTAAAAACRLPTPSAYALVVADARSSR